MGTVRRKSAQIGRDMTATAQEGNLVLSKVTDAYGGRSVALWIDRKFFGTLRRIMKDIEEQAFEDFVAKAGPDAPWLKPNDHGEPPGDICCLRACSEFCYEHDPRNYFKGKIK